MNVLLIGGTGLISTATTRALLEMGASVTHFNRGKRNAEPPPGVQTIVGDHTYYAAFEARMADTGTGDCVIDMVGYQPGDADSVIRAFGGKFGHFVFCSTVDVYDQPVADLPIREDAPRAGRNDYGKNKVVIEQTLERAAEQGTFPLTILHAFGGGTAWADRLRRSKPILVHGDGGSLWTADNVAGAEWLT